jgi:hypothetical protein
MHFDCRGNAIEMVERGEGKTRTSRTDYDVFGNMVAKFDALHRAVERKEFGMLGSPILERNMDTGTPWLFLPALANLCWNATVPTINAAWFMIHSVEELRHGSWSQRATQSSFGAR